MRRLAVSLMTVVLVASAASGGDGGGPKAPTPQTGPAADRFVVDVRAPSKVPEGAKPVVALLLSPKKDAKRFSEELGRVLRERGFHVWICQAPKGDWDAPIADALLAGAVRNVGRDPKHKGAAVLLVAASDAGRCARTAIDRFSGRLAGAVLISTTPLERSPAGIDLWAPRGEAWKVPLWSVVGTDPKDAAQTLLMWRQIASVAPEGSLLTIDVRLGQGGGYLSPDGAIGEWLGAIVRGRRPAPGPDRQAQQERKRYEGSAGRLLKAMKTGAALPPGRAHVKREGPLAVSVVAPAGWLRFKTAEREFDANEHPYVQMYLKAADAKDPLFAKVCAARWEGEAAALLDDYDKRLIRKGYLTIRHHRWSAGTVAMQISSVLFPTRVKWHRWLILSAAGPGSKEAGAAPLLLVMDASENPDAATAAGAAKQILRSVQVGRPGAAP